MSPDMKGLASFNQSEIRDGGFYMPGSEGGGTNTVPILMEHHLSRGDEQETCNDRIT